LTSAVDSVLAADRPLTAFDFFDHDPGHGPEVLAFDGDHGVGQLRRDLRLLRFRKHAVDQFDCDERHRLLLNGLGKRVRRSLMPAP
jgi:hypothetical protein